MAENPFNILSLSTVGYIIVLCSVVAFAIHRFLAYYHLIEAMDDEMHLPGDDASRGSRCLQPIRYGLNATEYLYNGA